VGVFAASSSSGDETGSPLVVAATDLRAGQVIDRGDVSVARGSLPAGAAGFASVEDVVGRAVLGPMASGELVQTGSVTPDRKAGAARREIALSLPREQLAVGRLRAGDRVDVFVTYDEHTEAVVQGAEVLQLVASDEGSLTASREVELVVAVESDDLVTALVHALRTGEVTVVRSTFAEEQPHGTAEGAGTGGDSGPTAGSGAG
jgi:Flp pilus assembly protein CpaB